MKKIILTILPIIVIFAAVLWYIYGFKEMLISVCSSLCFCVPLAFLLAKWIEFVETNIKD